MATTWVNELTAQHFTYDFAIHGGAVSTIVLGNLPASFVVIGCYSDVQTALVGGGTFVVGEDGGGDADGYFTDMDAVTGVDNSTGALVWAPPTTDAADIGGFLPHKVDSAKDGVAVTIATTAYTAGKVKFTFIGYQN